MQQPPVGDLHRPSVPPTPSPGPSGGLALRATWGGCTVWGAGIGADLNLVEPADGGVGTKLPYDLTGYRGITFWAAATPGSDTKLRFKVVMRAETRIRTAGRAMKTGRRQQVRRLLGPDLRAADRRKLAADHRVVRGPDEVQAGGVGPRGSPGIPRDVLGIQIQSQGTEMDQPFDFWIDDVYLIR